MPRRGALIVMMILALAGGAIMNLAVAWACVWWQKPIVRIGQVESTRASDEAKALWTEVFGPSVFANQLNDDRDVDPSTVPTSPIYGAMIFVPFENRYESPGMDRWSVFDMQRQLPPGVTTVCAGLPMRSFGCRFVGEARYKVPSRSILEMGGFMVRRGNGMVELPWKPLWPGFAINTMLYGVVVALLCLAMRNLRRARRRRCGLCVACAYPVGASSTCTECGLPVR